MTGSCGESLPSKATATSTSMVAASTGAANSMAAKKESESSGTKTRADAEMPERGKPPRGIARMLRIIEARSTRSSPAVISTRLPIN